MFETLNVQLDQGIATITLNRPKKLNAINPLLMSELNEALDYVSKQPIQVLILNGTGKAFCAGFDLNYDTEAVTVEEEIRRFNLLQSISRKIQVIEVPVIAVIHGYALGAGLEIALSCDFIYATVDTKLGFPEVKVGLSIGCGVSQLLVNTVGPFRAKELILLSEMIDAEEALKLNLLSKVVEEADLDNQINNLVYRLKSLPTYALSKAKSSLNQTIFKDIETTYQNEVAIAKDIRIHTMTNIIS